MQMFQSNGKDCHVNDSEFCEIIESSNDVFYYGCNDLSATLLPHPEYCTLFIQCDGNETRTSTTRCCSLGLDTDGDGCQDERLWFNSTTNECDYPYNVDNATCK